MGGSRLHAGFGNRPNGKWRGNPADLDNAVNNVKLMEHDFDPGCTNPPNPGTTPAFLDTAASLTLLGRNTHCERAAVQELNVSLGTPSKDNIMTTKTLELLLAKLPKAARRAFRVPDTPHNLMAGDELVDAGYGLHLYKTYAEIDYEGETSY